jgi:hypothetical protein
MPELQRQALVLAKEVQKAAAVTQSREKQRDGVLKQR